MELQFSENAAEYFRRIELFDRLALVDVFDDMRLGRVPEEDYGEITEEGLPVSVLVAGKFAISYTVNEDEDLVQIFEVSRADRWGVQSALKGAVQNVSPR